MTNQQPDFTALNDAWHIDGDTAQRGNVILRHYQNPSCYRASVHVAGLGALVASQYSATLALEHLRARIMHELAKHEAITAQLYDALAAIDAPEAPEVGQ